MTTSATAQTSANTTGSLQSNQTAKIDCVGGPAAIVRSNNDLWKPLKSRRRFRKEAARLRDLACKQPQGNMLKDELLRLACEYQRLPMRCLRPVRLVRAPLWRLIAAPLNRSLSRPSNDDQCQLPLMS